MYDFFPIKEGKRILQTAPSHWMGQDRRLTLRSNPKTPKKILNVSHILLCLNRQRRVQQKPALVQGLWRKLKLIIITRWKVIVKVQPQMSLIYQKGNVLANLPLSKIPQTNFKFVSNDFICSNFYIFIYQDKFYIVKVIYKKNK